MDSIDKIELVSDSLPNQGGRPEKYKSVFNDQAYKLCLLGATDKELANFFDVDVATINRWKLKHKGFCESLKRGKTKADYLVAEKLFHRATGYSHQDIDIKIVKGRVRKIKFEKHYPPDTTAAIFWLKIEIKITGGISKPLILTWRIFQKKMLERLQNT